MIDDIMQTKLKEGPELVITYNCKTCNYNYNDYCNKIRKHIYPYATPDECPFKMKIVQECLKKETEKLENLERNKLRNIIEEIFYDYSNFEFDDKDTMSLDILSFDSNDVTKINSRLTDWYWNLNLNKNENWLTIVFKRNIY